MFYRGTERTLPFNLIVRKDMLEEILEKKHYSFHHHFDDWREAIKASYEPLLRDKVIEAEYIDAVIACVEEYGPYIVIAPKVAMPHSTEGAAGCNGTAISFMKVENPVQFDKEDSEKDAKLFFSLASTDSAKHLENIQSLMEILMNEELVEALLLVKDEETLKEVINRF